MMNAVAQATDHLAGCLELRPSLIRSMAFVRQISQSREGPPELGRIVDRSRHLEGAAQGALRVVPVALPQGVLAAKPPALDDVLSRSRPSGSLQALVDMATRLVEITARQRQVGQAREEVHRVAPAHPCTRG